MDKSIGAVVLWLAAGAFAIGCSEFAAMSLLPYYAATFGVTEPAAGAAVSAYALGVVVGAPPLAAFGARLERRRLLVFLMVAFALANLGTALAPTMNTLIAARFVAGLPHGAYLGIAMLFAAELAGRANRARMVSYVILGLTVSTVVGVPLVSLIGQATGWRIAFALMATLAAGAALMIKARAPRTGTHDGSGALAELAAFRNPDVLLPLAMGAIGFGALFAVYAFFTATFMNRTDAPEWTASAVLVVFGLGGTLGSYAAGRVPEGRSLTAALGYQILLGVAAAFYAASVGNPWIMAAALFVIGLGGGMVVPLQTRLMEVAGEAQTMAAAMNHAAFNTANALGPFLAGLALTAGYGPRSPGFVGIGLACLGLLVWAVMARRQATTKKGG